MTNSIDTGNISDSEGIAIGRDAKSYVMNQHFYGTKHHFYGAKRPSYKPPQLPNLNSIPPPAKLPPYSRMILNRNQYFTGRNEQLKFLAEHLLYTTRPQSTAVIIHGIGGVGKTQLATEFVYRYGQFFEGGVFWLSFADKTVIPAEIVSCGGMMAIRPDFYDMSLKDQIQMVKNEWADGKKRLLIFDNCEEPTLLKNERLLGGDCRILITSRWADWGKTEGNKTLKLKKFPRKRSVELLRNLSNIQKPENDMTLNKIAEKLGDLPLALHLAACFLAAYGEVISPEDYLKQLSEKNTLSNKSMEGQGVQDNPTNHYLHVEKTFDISYEKLDHNDSLAHELLIRLAYFAPGEPVLYELLLATLDSAREDNSLLDFLEAIKRLTNLGLIEQEAKKHVKIHRLITEFIHLKPKKDSPQTVVENVLLIKAIEANKIGVPSRLFSWQTHLLHLTDAAIGSKSKKAADLCIQTSNHLDSIGNYPEARIYLESALEIREQQFKPDYPDIIKILSHLGNLSRVMEDFEKAISCFQRTLELREKIHGPNHPDLGFSFDNLGNLFLAMRQYDEARLNFERSLELRDQQLGSGHHETALSLDNLGTLLQIMGNYKEALSYYEKSLTIREKQLGLAHADTAISLNKIGGVVELMNNYQMALANYRRALQIREQLFKPDHPLIAQSLNNLGFLLHL
ncbi:MAG: tetratricopeptide repeat protein [Chloroflexi bacterium]|nr:MAG: tetratricopeptide repeat protein [Chloroflexota bacterium]